MSLPEDVARTYQIAEHAIAKIKTNELGAFPPNYEIWFAYAAGFNPALNKRINEILRAGERVSQDELEKIREEFFGAGSFEERVDAVGGQLSGKVSEIMDLINEAAGQTSGYSDELQDASKNLDGVVDEQVVQAIVQKLITMTDEVERSSRSMSNKLLESEQEIAALKEALESVRYEAMTDQLTGIGNRKRFDRAMDEAMLSSEATGEPFSLLVCDIDHFKKFNDTHGHQTGDQVLRLVGSTVKSSVSSKDIACRYGGEEFCVILPSTKIGRATDMANVIRQAVMGKELVKRSTGETLGRVTISIGVAELREDDSVQSIIERADKCLYAAKEAGRNRVVAEAELEANEKAA
ncbi:GGDEF domain-containing protein [Ahrensia marina]|uniref:GGDEF domain-containing protein n=1 Tax=Ahrensia marina TaxID=1514904 RepID=UPI0035D07D9E